MTMSAITNTTTATSSTVTTPNVSRTLLVTGALGGIGRAICHQFACRFFRQSLSASQFDSELSASSKKRIL